MNEFENNLENFIELFDVENFLFQNGNTWKEKGFLNKSEFLNICLWKSRRPKKYYDENSEIEIITQTKLAFLESNDKTKIELLKKLRGVSIPTASAILSVTDPKNYPIIDIRCIESLKDLKLISWENINTKNWIEYIEIVRNLAQKHNKTAREIEKGLFAYNRTKLDKIYRNLYKTKKLQIT